MGRLRREIEPVSAAEFVSFLFRWQHIGPNSGPNGLPDRRLHGPAGLLEVLAQLQGFPVAAGAWEKHVLPARLVNYDPWWLDQLCLQGDIAWGRFARPLNDGETIRKQGPTRAAPVAFALREDLPALLAYTRHGEDHTTRPPLSPHAVEARDYLRQRGALFFPELKQLTGRLNTEVEQAIGELVASGEVTGDGFGGLRLLIAAKKSKRPRLRRRSSGYRLGAAYHPTTTGGRWSLLSSFSNDSPAKPKAGLAPTTLEWLAKLLLKRYGVVFRDVLAREVALPPWRELVWCYRQLEARGEVRGGRFVSGFQGEQFALAEAVDGLRAARREGPSGQRIELSATDPLNLVGILTPERRVPAVVGNRVVFVEGVPVIETAESPAG